MERIFCVLKVRERCFFFGKFSLSPRFRPSCSQAIILATDQKVRDAASREVGY